MGRRPAARAQTDQDEELADLQRRFNLLEDEARQSVERNPAGGATPRAHQRAQRERTVATNIQTNNDTELAKLDEQITTLRRKHDELAHANMQKRRELEKLTDRLQDLSKEAQLPSAEDNPTMREIRALEGRLQRAVSKYEDAYEVRRTYEQIVKRLKEERIGFSNQLEARELTLKSKEGDYEELLLMSHDANQSKEMAKQELAKFEALVSEERKLREKVHPFSVSLCSWRSENSWYTMRRRNALSAPRPMVSPSAPGFHAFNFSTTPLITPRSCSFKFPSAMLLRLLCFLGVAFAGLLRAAVASSR